MWEPVTLGPFTGGINTSSDPSSVADEELVDCVNLELGKDSSLVTRPPINEVTGPGGSTRIKVLGGVILNGSSYIIGSSDTITYAYNGTAWTTITNTFSAQAVVQYNDKAYLVAAVGSANPGGSWDGTTFSAIAAMPKGNAATLYNERMWIADGGFTSRLSFSGVATADTWSASDFFDISPGDGQRLWDLVVYQNNLILFKDDSTYSFSYDTQPADAQNVKINNTIGVSGRNCMDVYENSIFVYHEGEVYEMINYAFVRINEKVPFEFDSSAPSTRTDNVFICVVGERLIVRYYNKIYVCQLTSKTWTRWTSAVSDIHNFGPFRVFPQNLAQDTVVRYYAGSSLAAGTDLFLLKDGFEVSTSESSNIPCSITTKNYDFGLSWKFKRMFFWGVDVLSDRAVVGTVLPVVFTYSTTWGSVSTFPWSALGPWDDPLGTPVGIETTVPAGSGTSRRFIKFPNGLRFRQVNFTVELETDGTLSDGPTRLYTLTIFMSAKQTAVKQVS